MNLFKIIQFVKSFLSMFTIIKLDREEIVDINNKRLLNGFKGDLKWIYQFEGYVGHPYWPGGSSGITLDPGFDLGYTNEERFEEIYGLIFTYDEKLSLKARIGMKGVMAKDALNEYIEQIAIDRIQAENIFAGIADMYWEGICKRFPALLIASTPPAVQTVMLSLAYNRGYNNKNLQFLGDLLSQGAYAKMVEELWNMQQDHALKGVRDRRRKEAKLIAKSLGIPIAIDDD